MTISAFDDLQRARLSWPEPLVLELITEIYSASAGHDDVGTAVRHHARFLRDHIGGESRPSSADRLKLIASCAGRAIAFTAIEAAEQAVFGELIGMARTRFRNSPRLLRAMLSSLHTAQDALTRRAERSDIASRRPFLAKRMHLPIGLGPSLAAAC